uniref:toprim domain-containing protein n=1 Tax=Aureimonas ureilytica TaxID=401562 RepID=UPI000475CE5D
GCGEGIETMLSVGTALPKLPIAACLTATHLGLFEVPNGVEQVWVFRDNDEAGRRGTLHLRERLREAGRSIRVREIVPVLGDFNDDLSAWGADALRARLRFDLGGSIDEFT